MNCQILHRGQHLLRHKANELGYQIDSDPSIHSVQGALDNLYSLVSTVFSWKSPVATQGDLPIVENSVNDARIVQDDGDGKPAMYVCVATVGVYSDQWKKLADIDFTPLPSLNDCYNYTGMGTGRQITADFGSVEITVPDNSVSTTAALKLNNNDVTNNSYTLEIHDATQGSSIFVDKLATGKLIDLRNNNVEVVSVFEDGSTAIGGVSVNSSVAILELISTTKGFIPPNMTTTEREAITAVESLIVWDTDLKGLFGYDGTNWIQY